jgi:hypothetical protein
LKENNGLNEILIPSNNDIHDEALINEFKAGVGLKILIMTPSYPFIFIGRIVEVVGDSVAVDVQVTTIGELENRVWFIHIHNIEVFYIEQRGLPRIPDLRDDL